MHHSNFQKRAPKDHPAGGQWEDEGKRAEEKRLRRQERRRARRAAEKAREAAKLPPTKEEIEVAMIELRGALKREEKLAENASD